MQQDQVYERARLARDARFDGQFYIGVRTTGIYCRPICPASPPKRENITFYPSAAAASEAGLRPCLRCRPESAPGTPAWSGTSTTVRRGLRLISGGALDDGNVETLADRLGVTSRHLRRLFTRHLGASPLAVAHTQRLHFAKRLIDETALPMSHISAAAGYGSIRRFNDTFRRTYGRSPRELRRANQGANASLQANTLSVKLACREPFNWEAMTGFFSHRAIPGVEEVAGSVYRRSLAIGDDHGMVELRPHEHAGYLQLSLRGVPTGALFDVVQSAREVFDLDAPVAEIDAVLRRDATLATMMREEPGIRVPGAWDGFELTVRAILGQQISVKGATTIAGRIAARYGDKLALETNADTSGVNRIFPAPERLARARFNNIGLVRSRAETIRSVAKAVLAGDVRFDASQDPEDFCAALTAIRGIGEWTAQYVAMRALKNPDAFPCSDLGLIKAIRYPDRVTPKELAKLSEAWRPWRAYAALLLWNSLAGSGG